jgi:hypothetical protein
MRIPFRFRLQENGVALTHKINGEENHMRLTGLLNSVTARSIPIIAIVFCVHRFDRDVS